MKSRFLNRVGAFLLGIFLINSAGYGQVVPDPASDPKGTVQKVDQGTFFCKFACTAGACAASKTVFERCKLCPQDQVKGCLMGASGVSVPVATQAAQQGQFLPPPGSCPTPAGAAGSKGKVKPLSDDTDVLVDADTGDVSDDTGGLDDASASDGTADAGLGDGTADAGDAGLGDDTGGADASLDGDIGDLS